MISNLKQTTFEIHNSPAGKVVIFNNLYFINGKFIFNGSIDEKTISTYPSNHYRYNKFYQFCPTINQIENIDENHIKTIATPHFFLTETYHNHPAHTLFDDVFSVFYSLYRCNIPYNPCICILDMDSSFNNIDYFDFKGVYELLFGYKTISLHHMNSQCANVCFDKFIVGNGDSSIHSYNADYVAPYQNNIMKYFRNALYTAANIETNKSPNKILYAQNNHYPITTEFKNSLDMHGIESIDWTATTHINDKLNILKNVKIFIAIEGSNAMNAIFLPDNAIIVNLGRMCKDYEILGYCIDFLFPALPYVDVFYFEDYFSDYKYTKNTQPNFNDLISIVKILNKSEKDNNFYTLRKSIYNNFELHISDKINIEIKINNISPNARLFIENFSRDEREKLVEEFKKGDIGFICNNTIRPFRLNQQ